MCIRDSHKMYETYMRDTPPNEASHASQEENYNESNEFNGTKGNYGTCPEASQVGLGRNGTCPEEAKRPTEPREIVNYADVGRMGRSEAGGMAEKKSSLF